MVADRAHMAQRGDGRGRILQERLLEGGVAPRLCHHCRAIARADLGLIGLDDGIECRRVDIALFGQDGFECAYPELGLRQRRALMVVLMVVIIVADSGTVKTCGFCPTCGSPVTQTYAARPELFTVHAASLDDPCRFKPQMVTYAVRGHSWDHLDPGLQKFDKMPPG